MRARNHWQGGSGRSTSLLRRQTPRPTTDNLSLLRVLRRSPSIISPLKIAEKIIQKAITSCLDRLGIPHICPPMYMRSTLPVGWPDLTFVVKGIPYAVEVKTAVGKRSKEQIEMHERLSRHGWHVHTVRSLDEFLKVINP